MVRNHYHTLEHYLDSGLRSFKEHTKGYLKGERTVPVGMTHQEHTEKPIYFTFTDSLLKMFIEDLDKVKKSYKAAITFGFRGHSLGHKNGIFYIGKRDKELAKAANSLSFSHKDIIEQDLETKLDNKSLRKVKIVWHNSSGERAVGLFNTKNNRMIFLGFAHY